MTAHDDISRSLGHDPDDDLWTKLYRLLLPKAKGWTYNSGVHSWQGQEYDVAWDIVHTAIERTLVYLRKARQQGVVVHSPELLSIVIAKNHYRDCRRHEQRLQRFSSSEAEPDEQLLFRNWSDASEEASEKIYEEWLLKHFAKIISTFSTKRREAILVDLANRMHFDAEPTALQKAFLAVGIRLQDYQLPQPADPVERARQAALRSLAYKSVARIASDMGRSDPL